MAGYREPMEREDSIQQTKDEPSYRCKSNQQEALDQWTIVGARLCRQACSSALALLPLRMPTRLHVGSCRDRVCLPLTACKRTVRPLATYSIKEFARLQVTFRRLAEVPNIKGVNNILGTITTTKALWWWIGADLRIQGPLSV
jgi:hypothetical protein